MEANLQDLSKDQLVDRIKTLEHTVTELQNKNDSLFKENSRRKELFDFSPTPMWEEDITELIEHLNHLKQNGIDDFERFFESNPEGLNECIKKIKLIDVNNATLALHKSSSKEHLINNLEHLFTNKSFEAFKREIIAIANGRKNFVTETNAQTFQNELIDLKLYLEILLIRHIQAL